MKSIALAAVACAAIAAVAFLISKHWSIKLQSNLLKDAKLEFQRENPPWAEQMFPNGTGDVPQGGQYI